MAEMSEPEKRACVFGEGGGGRGHGGCRRKLVNTLVHGPMSSSIERSQLLHAGGGALIIRAHLGARLLAAALRARLPEAQERVAAGRSSREGQGNHVVVGSALRAAQPSHPLTRCTEAARPAESSDQSNPCATCAPSCGELERSRRRAAGFAGLLGMPLFSSEHVPAVHAPWVSAGSTHPAARKMGMMMSIAKRYHKVHCSAKEGAGGGEQLGAAVFEGTSRGHACKPLLSLGPTQSYRS